MQIHELPSASPSALEYIPIDNGTATRKATLSSIDMGSNEITFTSGDTSSPSSWQTVAVMASNTAANLMNAISKMVANIRWLYNRLGTSSTGTTATTVTGAIAEHSAKIGNAEMGTTATTLTGAIAEVNDSVNTNTEDIATLNSKTNYSSQYTNSLSTSPESVSIIRKGNIAHVVILYPSVSFSADTAVGVMPPDIKASALTFFRVVNRTSGAPMSGTVWLNANQNNIRYYGTAFSNTRVAIEGIVSLDI